MYKKIKSTIVFVDKINKKQKYCNENILLLSLFKFLTTELARLPKVKLLPFVWSYKLTHDYDTVMSCSYPTYNYIKLFNRKKGSTAWKHDSIRLPTTWEI